MQNKVLKNVNFAEDIMLQVSRFGVRSSMKDVLLLYSSEYS